MLTRRFFLGGMASAAAVAALPNVALVTRERLAAARTYYVGGGGGDASIFDYGFNAGLTPERPFRSIQQALDAIAKCDIRAGEPVTVQVLPGTYAALPIQHMEYRGGGAVMISGATEREA